MASRSGWYPGGEPRLLMESAGKESCCIFRVPESFAEKNPTAYKPKVVSIGPYHFGKKNLLMIQQHKHRFVSLFLCKAKKKGVDANILRNAVTDLEDISRRSYSEELRKDSRELMDIIFEDGCFILVLLLIVSRIIELDEMEDPIFTIPWILPTIQSDLLLLENQVPFIVLQTLFNTSKINISADLNRMVFRFFNLSIAKPESYWVRHKNLKAKHLLDLIRMTFIPEGEAEDVQHTKGKSRKVSPSNFTLIMSATKISLYGIKFSLARDPDSVLDIRLKKNRLQIPLLKLDGFISSFLVNGIAFEQFYSKSTNEITSYAVFMACLLNGEGDATLLSTNNRIIENYFGSEIEVSRFFKTLCKDVVFDMHRSYLRNVFEGINESTSSKWSFSYLLRSSFPGGSTCFIMSSSSIF